MWLKLCQQNRLFKKFHLYSSQRGPPLLPKTTLTTTECQVWKMTMIPNKIRLIKSTPLMRTLSKAFPAMLSPSKTRIRRPDVRTRADKMKSVKSMHDKALNANADQVLDVQVIEANVKVSKITHSVEITEFFRHSEFYVKSKLSQFYRLKMYFCNPLGEF